MMLCKAERSSEKQIRERLDALDALTQHRDLLAKLESGDTPTKPVQAVRSFSASR
jgi:hypothetical protein